MGTYKIRVSRVTINKSTSMALTLYIGSKKVLLLRERRRTDHVTSFTTTGSDFYSLIFREHNKYGTFILIVVQKMYTILDYYKLDQSICL